MAVGVLSVWRSRMLGTNPHRHSPSSTCVDVLLTDTHCPSSSPSPLHLLLPLVTTVPSGPHRPHLQHLRAAHVHRRRARGQQLCGAGERRARVHCCHGRRCRCGDLDAAAVTSFSPRPLYLSPPPPPSSPPPQPRPPHPLPIFSMLPLAPFFLSFLSPRL